MSACRVAVRMKWGGSPRWAWCKVHAFWDTVPFLGCPGVVCPLLHGHQQRMGALEAASDFRSIPGSDLWTEKQLCSGVS